MFHRGSVFVADDPRSQFRHLETASLLAFWSTEESRRTTQPIAQKSIATSFYSRSTSDLLSICCVNPSTATLAHRTSFRSVQVSPKLRIRNMLSISGSLCQNQEPANSTHKNFASTDEGRDNEYRMCAEIIFEFDDWRNLLHRPLQNPAACGAKNGYNTYRGIENYRNSIVFGRC